MTQESDELVKRLREDRPVTHDMESTVQCDLQDAAADTLEAQAAEIERLESESEGALAIIAQERAEVEKLRKENGRLREALQDETTTYQHGYSTSKDEAKLIEAAAYGRAAKACAGMWDANGFTIGEAIHALIPDSDKAALDTYTKAVEAAALEKALTALDDERKAYIEKYNPDALNVFLTQMISDAEIIRNLIDPDAQTALAERVQAAKVETAKPLEEWHEDDGDVVWWVFPISEPAWIGTPNDDSWPNYHTHWTPHPTIPLIAATEGETE